MKVMVAKVCGYCYGVRRAERLLMEALEEHGRVKTYGPLINNAQMTAKYAERGASVVESIEEVSPGETIVVRAHGLPHSVYVEAVVKGIQIVDATCPFVAKIHGIVRDACRKGRAVVIFGSESHPEVIGIAGWCENPARIVQDVEEIEPTQEPLCVVVQTTYNRSRWQSAKEKLRAICPNAQIHNTICSATADRQNAAVEVARQVDHMIVIGDRSSSNTRRLYELCAEITDTRLIETSEELDLRELMGERVGVTAGASTPDWIIDSVILKIEEERNVE